MRQPSHRDRAAGSPERLGEDLPSEDPGRAGLRLGTAEEHAIDLLDVEQLDHLAQAGHRSVDGVAAEPSRSVPAPGDRKEVGQGSQDVMTAVY
ncbi:hypothetical protein GCM10009790_37980 [Georgenia ruanii]